ncbi:hypothetical protein [Allorhizocola rhizosphaerae]|uniref:hypothetical protein n=1 Tax=Allorhizocola rhizosphaerae TaxID=1872709 RepID=UPI000E3B8236|nr:hypothetical protein [Allorhizocola rhizosphaerae]
MPPLRLKHLRRRIGALAALVTAVVATAAVPANAAPPPIPECGTQIDEKLGTGYTAGFLGRWRDRFAGLDTAFSWNSYQGTPEGAPPTGVILRPLFREIAQQEKFDQLAPDSDRVCLVEALYTRMGTEGLDTTIDPNLVKTLMYSMLFTEGFLDTQFGGTEQLPVAAPQLPEPTELRNLIRSLRDLLGNPNLPLVDALARLPRINLPALRLPQLTLPHLPQIGTGLELPLPSGPPNLDLKLPVLDLAILQQLAASTISSATYLVCTNPSVTAPRATDRCGLPAALGTPTTADLNGDLLPDLLVTITLDLAAIANGQFGVTLGFTRTPLSTGNLPGKAYVIIQPPGTSTRVMIGTANAKTLARNTSAKITFESPDELADGVVRGPVQLRYSGADGATDTTFLFGTSQYENEPTNEIDQMSVEATLAPVPAQLDANLRVDPRPLAGVARNLFELTNVTASPVRPDPDRYDLHLAMRSQSGFKKQAPREFKLDTTMIDMPSTVERFALESFPAGGEAASRPVTVIDYVASSPVERVVAQTRSRLLADPEGTFKQTQFDVRKLPSRVHVDLTQPQENLPASTPGETVVHYTAPTVVPFAQALFTSVVSDKVKSSIDLTLTDVPREVTATTLLSEDGSVTDVTAVAPERIGGAVVDATFRKFDGAGSATHVWGSATSLPPVFGLKLNMPGGDNFSADYAGRSAPDQPEGSAGIDKLHFKMAKGSGFIPPEFLKPDPKQPERYAAQHAFVQTETGGVLLADLRLDALALADVGFSDPGPAEWDMKVDADVRGAGGEKFVTSVNTPGVKLVSDVAPLPKRFEAHVEPDAADSVHCPARQSEPDSDDLLCIRYEMAEGVAPDVTTNLSTATGLTLDGTVTDMPMPGAKLRLNKTQSTLEYRADAPLPKVTALVTTPVAKFRRASDNADPLVTVDATLTNAPKDFDLSYDPEHIAFEALEGGAVGEVDAKAALDRNQGTLNALQRPSDNHVHALLDDNGKNFYAAVKLTNLRKFSYEKTAADGLVADFDGATGVPLDLDVDVHSPGKRLVIQGGVANVPPALHLEKSDVDGELGLKLTAGAPYEADARVLVGTPDAVQSALSKLDEIPRVEGISARDWRFDGVGVATGLGVRFHDAPTYAEVNMKEKKFIFDGYAPDEVQALDVDVILDAELQLHVQGGLTGFRPDVPSGVTIGPVVQRTGKPEHGKPDLALTIDANGVRPAADLLVVLPGDAEGPPGKQQQKMLGIDVEALPHEQVVFSMENFVGPEPEPGKTPDTEMRFKAVGSVPLGKAKITYGPMSHPEALVADLADVPASFDLSLGNVIAPPAPDPCKADPRSALPTQFPKVVYTASDDNLDANLELDVNGLTGLDGGMTVRLEVSNLGGTGQGTTMFFDRENWKLRASSEVATTRLYAEVEGLSKGLNVSDPGPCDVPPQHSTPIDVDFVVDVGFKVEVPLVTVELKQLKSMEMNVGVASSVLGDFDEFDLDLFHVRGEAAAQVGVDIIFDFGGPFHGTVGLRVGPKIVGNFIPLFHIGQNTPGMGFPIVESPIPCDLGIPPPTFGIGVRLQPGLQSSGLRSVAAGGFHLTRPGPDQGHAWTITPNIPLGAVSGGGMTMLTPQLPAWAIHLVTFAMEPEGTQRDFDFGITCQ